MQVLLVKLLNPSSIATILALQLPMKSNFLVRISCLPSGNLTLLWNIIIINGKIRYKWPFSIAMFVYQRLKIQDSYWLLRFFIFFVAKILTFRQLFMPPRPAAPWGCWATGCAAAPGANWGHRRARPGALPGSGSCPPACLERSWARQVQELGLIFGADGDYQ